MAGAFPLTARGLVARGLDHGPRAEHPRPRRAASPIGAVGPSDWLSLALGSEFLGLSSGGRVEDRDLARDRVGDVAPGVLLPVGQRVDVPRDAVLEVEEGERPPWGVQEPGPALDVQRIE